MGFHHARHRTRYDAGDAEIHQPPALLYPEDDAGPQQVELLLNAQGPEMSEEQFDPGKALTMHMPEAHRPQDRERLKWEKKLDPVADVSRPNQPDPVPIPVEDGVDQRQHQEHRVIQRKDTQCAPNIEVPDAMQLVARIEKDAGNQETGENEKNIDAGPSPWHFQIVVPKDHQERDGAQTIQRREISAVCRARLLCVPANGFHSSTTSSDQSRPPKAMLVAGVCAHFNPPAMDSLSEPCAGDVGEAAELPSGPN